MQLDERAVEERAIMFMDPSKMGESATQIGNSLVGRSSLSRLVVSAAVVVVPSVMVRVCDLILIDVGF